MLGYDFEIIYKKGENVVENALSRKEDDIKSLLFVISIMKSDWI